MSRITNMSVVLLIVLGLYTPARAQQENVITGVTATASSMHESYYGPESAVNRSGLYLGTYPNEIHHGGHHSGVGNSVNQQWFSQERTNEWFKVDLGAVYRVDTLRFWNGSFRGTLDTDSVKDGDIYYSSLETDPGESFGDNPNWKLFGAHTFVQNPSTAPPPPGVYPDFVKTEEIDMGGKVARWIAFDLHNNYGHGDWMAIAEMQFEGREFIGVGCSVIIR